MIRKWLLASLAGGGLILGMAGCGEETPAEKKGGKKPPSTAEKPGSPTKPGTAEKPTTAKKPTTETK
jgi:hypothetical protein